MRDNKNSEYIKFMVKKNGGFCLIIPLINKALSSAPETYINHHLFGSSMDPLQILIVAVLVLVFLLIGFIVGKFVERKKWEGEVDSIRADAVKRSRSVLTGTFSEQLAPYLPGFNHSPTEVRFIGKPIDFIVFEGMDEKEIKKVVFLEVKSGKSTLNAVERSLRDAVQAGKVEWATYHPPEPK